MKKIALMRILAICYFSEKCRNKLCQFKQIEQKDSEEISKDDLSKKFNRLTDMEKDKSKEVFCDIFILWL
jgi:hypothetical protein